MNNRVRLTLVAALLTTQATAAFRVTFVTPDIVRVQRSAADSLAGNGTGVCVYDIAAPVVAIKGDQHRVEYLSETLIVEVDKQTEAVRFVDRKSGKELLRERLSQPCEHEPVYREHIVYDEASAHTENTANGQVTVRDEIRRDTIGVSTRYRLYFESEGTRALYGLGSHMEDYMNLVGKTLYLTQHNLKAMVPVLTSPDGYGLLFDAGCAMRFVSTERDGGGADFMMEQEASPEVDYYFMRGDDMAEVVGEYRQLTGAVSLLPKYVFGYTQSKERYCSSDEIVSVLKEYRRRHVPIDMIVQDWNYWPQGWGYMKMDERYYPDPKALADSVHALNAKLMVSIWPNPQWCPEAEDLKQHGYMLQHDVYDVFNPEARKYYWGYADREFFSRGFDAWWCDSSEPLDGDWNRIPQFGADGKTPYGWDDQEMRWHLNQEVLSEALGAERSSLYSLYHSMGIYENQRLTGSDKRVVNLTRSSYAGQQRYGTIVWNGDTHASWESFRQQIPSGLNYMATGNPYWTVDVGSFFTRDDGHRWFYKGAFPGGCKSDEYREYYLRMFQWATFLPVLRSHGSDTPREIWQFGEPGGVYYDALLDMIQLRYRLVPYIYSMAAMQSRGGYTMARPLAFDASKETETGTTVDPAVLDIKDEYMMGDFLVCPVTEPGVVTRRVYLPAGREWTDYWTGERHAGGQWITAATPLNRLPLYLPAGTLLVTTEVAEYVAAQEGQPLTVTIVPGADATFTLYEDAGDGYGYEQGECAEVKLIWDDAKRKLTIGARAGSYPGMSQEREVRVVYGGADLRAENQDKNYKKGIEPHSTRDNSLQGCSTRDNSLQGCSVRDSSMQGNSTRDNSMQGNSTGDHSMQGNSTRDHSMQGNSTGGNSMQDNIIKTIKYKGKSCEIRF